MINHDIELKFLPGVTPPEDPYTRNYYEKNIRLMIGMVALPARGKSYTAHKLHCFLQWLGIKAKTFSVGDDECNFHKSESDSSQSPGRHGNIFPIDPRGPSENGKVVPLNGNSRVPVVVTSSAPRGYAEGSSLMGTPQGSPRGPLPPSTPQSVTPRGATQGTPGNRSPATQSFGNPFPSQIDPRTGQPIPLTEQQKMLLAQYYKKNSPSPFPSPSPSPSLSPFPSPSSSPSLSRSRPTGASNPAPVLTNNSTTTQRPLSIGNSPTPLRKDYQPPQMNAPTPQKRNESANQLGNSPTPQRKDFTPLHYSPGSSPTMERKHTSNDNKSIMGPIAPTPQPPPPLSKAMKAILDQVFAWLEQGGEVGIFDATNTTKESRAQILSLCNAKEPRVSLVFIENICDDPKVLAENFKKKIHHSKEYKGVPYEDAAADLKRRILKYDHIYRPLEDDEPL